MTDKKIIIASVLITALILGGGVFFLSKSETSANIATSQNAEASVDQKNFDWGQINMKAGNVSKTFTIKNSGTEILKLYKIRTSCHCTKARVKIGSTTSPFFGMNTVSSWTGEIPPGQEAELEVIFDPAYHGPQGVGPINRLVSIETNDKSNSRIEFSLTGTVFKQ
ncbi:DUF1573 domain-containing protein [Candidatus Daviesbacteria bacterium]|nr:DUF1573 domain-containing protein [Candidatus Daviesbacteria bacterium]